MVTGFNSNWRKQYYQAILAGLKELCGKSAELPPTLTLPASTKNCMFEFGGSKFSSGTAMVVATPSGFPNSAIVLKQRRKNGLHVSSKVWINCLVGVAHHQYGITNIGIYQVKRINSVSEHSNEVQLTLLAGIAQASPDQTRDPNWFAPYHRKYPGLKKLVATLLDKLETYNCTTPMYLEPFRVIRKYTQKDPDFNKLMLVTDLVVPENISDLVPKYAVIESNMAETKNFTHFYQFEAELISVCKNLVNTFPYVYVLYCHHNSPNEDGQDELITHAFVAFQESEGKPLMFHKVCFIYHHTGAHAGKSSDLESFIRSNYNESYLHSLLGVHGGGIPRLLNYIGNSKDGCLYVPLKYALCTKRYNQYT